MAHPHWLPVGRVDSGRWVADLCRSLVPLKIRRGPTGKKSLSLTCLQRTSNQVKFSQNTLFDMGVVYPQTDARLLSDIGIINVQALKLRKKNSKAPSEIEFIFTE